MTKILNHINTYADLTAYNNDMEKDFPNVSYLVATDEVKWAKDDPVHIVCKYNVTSTESATKLLNSNSGITYQIIDGVRQDAVQTSYTFDTLGEHIVKYKLDGTSIGNQAFYGCSGLTSVTIPDNVISIGYYAFGDCTGLTSVTIPDNVISIGYNAFDDCSSLTSVTIPNSVTTIGKQAFYNCSNLTSVTIPDSVTTIGQSAFNSCTGLTSISIGSGVTTIGDYAFNSRNNVSTITVSDANQIYDSRNNCNAIIETASNTLIAGCSNTIIPEDIENIYMNAFVSLSQLTNITIPDSVTSIGNYAFYGCTGLASVTIGSGVTSIGERAFFYLININNINILATTPPTLPNADVFANTNNCPIYVPAESVETYKAATNWSSLASRIKPISE